MEMKLEQFNGIQDVGHYTSMQHEYQENENTYESTNVYDKIDRRHQLPPPDVVTKEKKKESSWSKPLLFITVLLCLILILLIIILGIAGWLAYDNYYATGNNVECTNTATGASNTNEWADRIAQNISQKIPDFDEWSNGVVSKVNSNVTGSLPDFNEWANGVSQNTLQLFQNNTNFTELDKQILQTTTDSAQKLINIVKTLSNLQDTSTSTAGVVDDTFLFIIHLLLLHNSTFGFSTSCKQIKTLLPTSPSGYYILGNGSSTYTAYCNMRTLCGSGGGWTRLAYLDMTDATQNCPSGFRLYQSGSVRACGRPVTNSGSCVSVQFPSNGISYSQICGRVVGYQFGSNDALHTGNGNNHNNLNADYVDGVSLTRGSPRQHVWTFMGGVYESINIPSNCPCTAGSPQINIIPDFIGNNYFCESGNPTSSYYNQFFVSDPLWDGKLCRSLEAACCNVPGIPWFHRDYGNTTTTDYIELRVCGDEGTKNEDTPFGLAEIYVK